MIVLGIMELSIMMKPRRMNTMPRWKVVTMEPDLSGGGLSPGPASALSLSSSRVPVLATLCRLVHIRLGACAWAACAPAPLSRLILLSLRWCLFSRSARTAMALWIAEVSGILCHEVTRPGVKQVKDSSNSEADDDGKYLVYLKDQETEGLLILRASLFT